MKQLLALLLALMMVLSLAACGDKEETPSGGSYTPGASQGDDSSGGEDPADPEDTGVTPQLDFGAIMAGNGKADTVWGKQDEATKQAIIAEGKKDGVDVSFAADGSMTVVDPVAGDTMIQSPDGTWSVKSEDGTVGQYGGNWPENEFTKLLPKPDFTLTAATTNETECTVAFQDADIEQIRAYVEKVKAAGFTIDPTTEDQEVMGMIIYTYVAKNADGYTVSVSSAMGVSAIEIEKP